MSEIIDQLPEVAEIDAQIAAQRIIERDVTERAGEVRRKYHQAMSKWESAAVEAELSGKRVPERPPEPDFTTASLAVERVRARVAALVTERQRAIVRAGDEVHAEALTRLRKVIETAAPHVEALETLVPQARVASSAVDMVADARQATNPLRHTPQRHAPAVDVRGLLAACSGGPGVLLSGRDPSAVRRLGLQPHGNLGDVPTLGQSGTVSHPVDQTVTVRGADGKPM